MNFRAGNFHRSHKVLMPRRENEDRLSAVRIDENRSSKALYLQCAEALTGRKTLILWQDPAPGQNVAGRCTVRNGVQVIWITPWMAEDRTLRTFLHECAHLILDRDTFDQADRVNYGGASMSRADRLASRVAAEVHNRIYADGRYHGWFEKRADALADEWLAFAEGNDTEERLQSLIRAAKNQLTQEEGQNERNRRSLAEKREVDG